MNITVFAIFKDKVNFFIRVSNGFEGKHDVTFLTTRYSSYRIIKQAGYKVHMLQEFINDDINIDAFEEHENEAILMDVKAGFLSESRARKQFDWLAKGFKNYFATQNVDKLMLWNGSMLQGFTASLVADSFKINKLFFEVGNFPNKIFVDQKGVNAKSSLMDRDLTICENYDEEKIVKFLDEHKKKKEEVHIVPQAKVKKNISLDFVYNRIYNIITKYPITESEQSIFNLFVKRYLKNKINFHFNDLNYKEEDYVFFPLQVSTDSQLLRNSDITIIEAIGLAIKESDENNCKLIIKPHPAENNIKLLEYISSLSNNNIYILNENTYKLIKYSKKVITINSTVGIESLMYYKPTIVLGNAFYKPYTNTNECNINKTNNFLYNYLFNILKDEDYFGTENLDIDILKEYLC